MDALETTLSSITTGAVHRQAMALIGVQTPRRQQHVSVTRYSTMGILIDYRIVDHRCC